MCGQKISKKNFWEKIPPVMGYPEIVYSNPENFRLMMGITNVKGCIII
jgi:hypothetical protein